MEPSLLDNLFTLGMLVMLQAVLGFDNLLYVSLESKNAPLERQSYVRRIGIGMAIFLRIALLFILIALIERLEKPFFSIHTEFISGEFNLQAIIVLLGGGFIIYTAVKEIWHMISLEEHAEGEKERKGKTVGQVIFMITLMNLVFSFDSILSAMALTKVPWVMVTAIVIGGVLMIVLSDRVANFLQRNRMYEVLGMFILFLVGIMLLTEGGHVAHLHIFGNEITQMSKTTFYFVLFVLVIVDIIQGRYQKKISRIKDRRAHADTKTN